MGDLYSWFDIYLLGAAYFWYLTIPAAALFTWFAFNKKLRLPLRVLSGVAAFLIILPLILVVFMLLGE